MNTEFYRVMLKIKRDHEWSSREMAKACNLCYGTLIEFFNVNKPFRPLRDSTMAKINHAFDIPYEVMEQYNKEIIDIRKG